MRRSAAEMTNLHGALAGRQTVRRVAELLGRHGIDVLPMKGALLYALGCTDPWARSMLDVDLLVRRDDFQRALGLLARDGWIPTVQTRAATVLEKPGGQLSLDLHHRLYAYGRFGPSISGLWRRARRDRAAFGVEVLSMDPLDLYAHLVGHFAKERLDERQAERLVDVARVAAQCELDATRVALHLDAEGLGRAGRYTLSIARDAGDTFAAMVLARLSPDALGGVLARVARRTIAAGPQPWKPAAVPTALLDRSLLASARSLADHTSDAAARFFRSSIRRR